jgi:acetyl esterase/lipase
MRWRRAALIGLGLLAAIFVYQAGYLACATAKALGYGYAFDLWRGPVVRSTIRVGAIETDVYSASQSHFPLVLVHGVNESGKDSTELRTLAEMLAEAGFRVFVPEMVRMTRQNVTPQDIDDVSVVFRSLQSDGGLLCASYGCGPALIAASRPDIRNKVRFIVTYGAYFDFTDTMRFVITAPSSPMAYSKWVYMAANTDLINDDRDRMSLIAVAKERQNQSPEQWTLGTEDLGSEGRAMLSLFESETPEQFDTRLKAVPNLLDRITRLSPSRYLAGVKGRLVIVHMESDPSIPSSESVRMAKAAQALGIPYHMTILNMYGHTKPLRPPFGIRSFFLFYLPESLKAMGVVNEILRYA